MKIGAILSVLAMLSAFLRAQAPAAKPGRIDGVVVNSVTSEPIKKAGVTLQGTGSQPDGNPPSNPVAITNAAGQFHFDNVAPGSYSVRADRDGFMPEGQTHTSPANFRSITVADEQHVQDVAIKLLPLGSLSGHVLDENGEPVVPAQVAVFRYGYRQGRKQFLQIAGGQTNDLGEFEELDLPPGRYYLQALAPQLRNVPPHTRWSRPEEAYPITFFPNVHEAGQATAIDVAAGAHLGNLDFRLRKQPAYHIRGTVTGADPQANGPTARVMVQLPDSNFGLSIADTGVQSDGSFDLRGLPSGSYKVIYMQYGQGKVITTEAAVHVADADVNGMALALKQPADLPGTVTVEGPLPAKWDLQVSLLPRQGFGEGGNSTVSPDGKFVFEHIPPAQYLLQIPSVPAGRYVKSIRLGDQEVKNGEFDLNAHPGASLNILLGGDGGEVEGTVQNASGQLTANTLVMLAPGPDYDGRWDLRKQISTDPGGKFRIEDVAPGDYKVFAWETNPDGDAESAEFRKPFESKSVSVTVGPKDKASVQLTVITADEIEKERSRLP